MAAGGLISGFALFAYLSYLICWKYWKSFRTSGCLASNEYICLVYLVSTIITFFGMFLGSLLFGPVIDGQSSGTYLALSSYIQCPIILTTTIIQGRIYRKEKIKFQVLVFYPLFTVMLFNANQLYATTSSVSPAQEILESKREFVRFIAHELRNPLNTVYLGLNLLKRSLKEIFVSEDIIQILRDVQLSCDATLGILNDMLSYEKLDAGILTLDRSFFSPMALLESSIGPFLIQVRPEDRHPIPHPLYSVSSYR